MLDHLETFLTKHPWVLMAALGFTMVFVIGIFIAALVHAYRGSKHPFPMAISAAVIACCLFYTPYCVVFFESSQQVAKFWFFASYATINEIHWVLAHRYH